MNTQKEMKLALPSSSDEILLLHNPKCSKSRATLALVKGQGVAFETRHYLDDPLGRDELADLAVRLGKSPLEFVRKKQDEFEEAGLSDSSPPDEVLAAMAKAPMLMERPILIRGDRAVIGRPPEDVLALLGD